MIIFAQALFFMLYVQFITFILRLKGFSFF